MIGYSIVTTGGVLTVTFHGSKTITVANLVLSCYSGIAASPVNQSGQNSGSSTSPASSSETTTQADELLYGVMGHNGGTTTITKDADYTQRYENENGDSQLASAAQDRIVSSTLTDTANWTLAASRSWLAAIVTFKASTGTTYQISGSGSSTPTGAITKAVSRFTAGASSPSGALTKAVSLLRSGSVSPSGAVTKTIALARAGASTPVGAVTKLIGKLLGGSSTPTGDLDIVTTLPQTFELYGSGSSTPKGALSISLRTAATLGQFFLDDRHVSQPERRWLGRPRRR